MSLHPNAAECTFFSRQPQNNFSNCSKYRPTDNHFILFIYLFFLITILNVSGHSPGWIIL